MSPTFAQLVAEVAAKSQLTKLATRRVLETFFAELAEATWASGRVVVPGLGAFRVRARRQRRVHNPAGPVGSLMMLPAVRVVACRVAKSWRRRG